MRAVYVLIIAVACLPLCVGSVSATGAEGLTITISNDSTDNVLLTAYDRNAKPAQLVLSGQPVYGFASIVISLSASATGLGHLSWTARSIDPDMATCGRGNATNLHDGDTVNVHADGDCGAR
jgi:hypothetical protein